MKMKTILLILLVLTSRWAEATLSQSQTFTPANGTIADGNPVGAVFSGTFSQPGFNSAVTGVSIGLNISGGLQWGFVCVSGGAERDGGAVAEPAGQRRVWLGGFGLREWDGELV